MFDEMFKSGLVFGSDPNAQLSRYLPPQVVQSIPEDQRADYVKMLRNQVGLSLMAGADPNSAVHNTQKQMLEFQKFQEERANAAAVQRELSGVFGGNTPPQSMVLTPEANAQRAAATGGAGYDRRASANQYFKAATLFAARGNGEAAKKYLDMGMQLHPNPSEAIRDLEYLGFNMAGTGEAGFANIKAYNESKSSKVNVGTQDKTFGNEMDLRKEFTALPIYKAFTEVQTAYDQINQALKNPSPANDMAAATKFMKLLDPGSVVRESELNMAMSATGLWDRINNYHKMLMNGEKLTPSQRKDFYGAAAGLYQAAQGRFAPEAERYRTIAQRYKLDPDNVVRIAPTAPEPTSQKNPVRTWNRETGTIE